MACFYKLVPAPCDGQVQCTETRHFSHVPCVGSTDGNNVTCHDEFFNEQMMMEHAHFAHRIACAMLSLHGVPCRSLVLSNINASRFRCEIHLKHLKTTLGQFDPESIQHCVH